MVTVQWWITNRWMTDSLSCLFLIFVYVKLLSLKFMVNSVIYMLRLNASRYFVRGYVERDFSVTSQLRHELRDESL